MVLVRLLFVGDDHQNKTNDEEVCIDTAELSRNNAGCGCHCIQLKPETGFRVSFLAFQESEFWGLGLGFIRFRVK